MQRALTIWALPATDFKPAQKQLDSYTLEDEAELTGRQIVRFNFKNSEQPVTSWVEMYTKVIQTLYDEDKTIITKLSVSSGNDIAYHFTTDPDAFAKRVEIGDGIYVWTNTSTQNKLSVLSRLVTLYGKNLSDLVFYLRDENDQTADESGSRYELRRRYWAFALPMIKASCGENGPFSHVSPSKDNWINGYFGVSGFYLCCVANYDAARVEVVFGKASKEENKKAFEKASAHKETIESALCIALIWDKGEQKTSSKIYFQLSNVSIENEVDWLQMARFHADWMKRFYDVIVPYIAGE